MKLLDEGVTDGYDLFSFLFPVAFSYRCLNKNYRRKNNLNVNAMRAFTEKQWTSSVAGDIVAGAC